MKKLISIVITTSIILSFILGFKVVFFNNYYLSNQYKTYPISDGLAYSFNKEKINLDLTKNKEDLIKQANTLINNGNYIEAKELLQGSIFTNDIQVLSLLNLINLKQKQGNMVPYLGEVNILEFNPIISFPEILKKNSSYSVQMDENQITIDEFERILLSLYNNNYVLVNIKSFTNNPILPRGKKPIVLLLNSSEYRTKLGNVDKLMLDDNNTLVTYTPKRSINDRLHHSNDFITALSKFVDNHPTFSHNNAKGLICVDGSHGILGYKTQKTNANSKFQIKKCTELTTVLKYIGWQFASKGYKYGINESDINFSSGLSHWKETVEPILGNTSIYYGSFDINTNDYKLSLFDTYNYNVFISNTALETHNTGKTIYFTTKISGKSLRENGDELSKYFDCEKVYDHLNRNTTFCSI